MASYSVSIRYPYLTEEQVRSIPCFANMPLGVTQINIGPINCEFEFGTKAKRDIVPVEFSVFLEGSEVMYDPTVHGE